MIVRVSPDEHAALTKAAALIGTNAPDVLRRGGLGFAWRLSKLRELMNNGMTADQAATFLVAGSGAEFDDGTLPAADRL